MSEKNCIDRIKELEREFKAAKSQFEETWLIENEKKILALEGEVAELKEQLSILKPHPLCDTSCLLSCSMEADYAEKQYLENKQLQASNNDLREALETLITTQGYKYKFGKTSEYESMRTNAWDSAGKALSATPAESLQAHDYSDTERLNFLDRLQERATSDMKINMSLKSDIHINGSLGVSLYIRNYKGHTESTAYGKTIREAIDMALKEVK